MCIRDRAHIEPFIATATIDENDLPVRQLEHRTVPLRDIQKRDAKPVAIDPESRRPQPPTEQQHHGDPGDPSGPVLMGCDPHGAKTSIKYEQRRQRGRSQVPLTAGYPRHALKLSLIHISEPTRLLSISYAVFCLK